MFPLNMLRKWTPLDVFLTSMIPGSPCLGPPLLSWGWTMRKAGRSLGQETLLLCFPSARLSKMPLINLSMTIRPRIYLRVNISNLLPLLSGTRWDKIQELNTDFSKICITSKPSGAPMGMVPLPILKELEHQARQNISTLNFTAAFAKTSFSCNATQEKCQYRLKST